MLIAIIFWVIYHRSRALSGYLEFNHIASEGRPLQVSIARKWDTKNINLPPQLTVGKAVVKNLDGKCNEISLTFKCKGKKVTMQLNVNQTKQMMCEIPYQVRFVGTEKKTIERTGPTPQYDPYASSKSNVGHNPRPRFPRQ